MNISKRRKLIITKLPNISFADRKNLGGNYLYLKNFNRYNPVKSILLASFSYFNLWELSIYLTLKFVAFYFFLKKLINNIIFRNLY
jgi:hypothetical protein